MSDERVDESATVRADYPALATLYDAWVGSAKKAPEAVRAFIELARYREARGR